MPLQHILHTVIAFAVLGGVLRLIERFFPARPQHPLFTRRRFVDVLYWFIAGPVGRVIADATLMIAVVLAIPSVIFVHRGAFHPTDPFGLFRHLPVVVQFPIALVAVDFFSYFSHRAHHHVRLLWRLHAVHHSSRELDWLAAARNHPIAEATGRVLGGLPLLFLGIDPQVLVTILPLTGLWAIILHANVRWRFGFLRFVIATPAFHRWHHSRAPEARDKNFAAFFPIWDLVFGTFYLPEHQPEDFGVDEQQSEAVPDGFIAQMLYPFRGLFRRRAPRSLLSPLATSVSPTWLPRLSARSADAPRAIR